MTSAPLRVTLEGHPRAHPLQGASLFLGTDADGRWLLGREVPQPAVTLIPGDGSPVLVPLGGDVFLDRRRLRAGKAVRLRGGERVRVGRAVVHVRRSDGRQARSWGRAAAGLVGLALCAALGAALGTGDPASGGDEGLTEDLAPRLEPQAARAGGDAAGPGGGRPASPPPEVAEGTGRDPVAVALAEAAGLARIGAGAEAERVLLASLRAQGEGPGREALLEALATLGAREPAERGPEPLGPLDRPPPSEPPASEETLAAPVAEPDPEPAAPAEGEAVEPEPAHLVDPQPAELPRDPEPEALGARAPLPEPPPPPDPLQGQVERAIQQGTARLLTAEVPERAGAAALEAFAMLRSGVHPQHPAVAERFARFEAEEVGKTYDLALGIMAYEAASLQRVAPAAGGGSRPRYARQRLGAKARRELQALTRRLLAGQSERGWGYDCPRPGSRSKAPRGLRCDNSNTQFAVLGLHAAERCGVEVPRKAWEQVLEHFLGDAVPPTPGQRVALSWTEERPPVLAPPDADEGTRARGERSESSDRRGWGYGGGRGERLSMTCAGLSSLAIAANALEQRGVLGADDADAARQALLGGLRQVPRRLNEHGLLSQSWPYYTVYSLEKAMDVCGVQALDAVQWWRVAAAGLVARQRADGGWGAGTDTAFALLVLNRATLGLGEETRVRGGGGGGVAVDPLLVRVGREQVYLPGVLASLARKPSGKLRRQAQRALDAVTPASRPRLVSDLTPLLDSSSRSTRTWAAKALRAITEERLDARGYAAWSRRFALLDGAQAPLGPEAWAAIEATLRSAPDGPLLRAAAVACVRAQASRALGGLVEALGRVEDEGTRRELSAALRLLTGADPADGAADAAAAWRAWLEERGA